MVAEKETTVYIDDREFKVVSIFNGTKTASELLCNLAVKKMMYANDFED